jgi:hypothetical protein
MRRILGPPTAAFVLSLATQVTAKILVTLFPVCQSNLTTLRCMADLPMLSMPSHQQILPRARVVAAAHFDKTAVYAKLIFEAAQSMLARSTRWYWLKA